MGSTTAVGAIGRSLGDAERYPCRSLVPWPEVFLL